MELRPGYKKTEMGVIPDDWEIRPISELARLESGHTPSKRFPTYWNGDVAWVSLHDTESLDENFIYRTSLTITKLGLDNSSARLLPAGTIVFSRTATVGKASILGTSMATSQDFANYICGPLLNNLFLVYLFRWMRPTWQSLMAGSIHNTIYMPAFESLKIVVPPLSEQKAIAEALSDVDASIAALSRLIAKKRDLRQGAMQRLLTGQTRLPGFTAPWQEKRLGELAVVRSQKVTGAALPIGTPCVELDQIASGSGRLIATGTASITSVKNSFEPGDVLFGRLRAYLRKFWLADRKGVCSTEIWPLVPVEGQATSGFIFYTVQRSDFIDAATQSYGTHMPRSDWGVVKNFEVLAPRPDEQAAIAQALSDMDEEIAALDARLDKTRALKQAMMQALLTGRVRLPVRRDAAPQTKEAAHA